MKHSNGLIKSTFQKYATDFHRYNTDQMEQFYDIIKLSYDKGWFTRLNYKHDMILVWKGVNDVTERKQNAFSFIEMRSNVYNSNDFCWLI